jgi:hypothetical protein
MYDMACFFPNWFFDNFLILCICSACDAGLQNANQKLSMR